MMGVFIFRYILIGMIFSVYTALKADRQNKEFTFFMAAVGILFWPLIILWLFIFTFRALTKRRK